MEWLDQVVVGARLEAVHFVLPAPASGQNEDGKSSPVLSPAPDYVDTGALGEADIDNGDVHRILLSEVEAFLAIGGGVYRIARTAKSFFELFPEGRFVFDDQSTHGSRSLQYASGASVHPVNAHVAIFEHLDPVDEAAAALHRANAQDFSAGARAYHGGGFVRANLRGDLN
jgi:hypothetical protein